MTNNYFFNTWISWCFTLALILPFDAYSTQIHRIDLFDKAGNSLLFVELEYDSEGRNTGRSVYASDSTFLRKTSFLSDASGRRSKEVSFNFNNDTIGYTTFSSVNGNPAISVFDQFGLNQFGAPVSYTTDEQNLSNIYHNGSVIYKMNYVYSGSVLNRIDVLNTDNSLLYYATMTMPTETSQKPIYRRTSEPKISISANRFTISAALNKKTHLKVCIYTISGSLISIPYSEVLKPGLKQQQFSFKKHDKLPAGLYIVRLYVDGKATTHAQKIIIKSGVGR